jgi:hypothetical protein
MATINRLAEDVWKDITEMKPTPYTTTEKVEVPNTYDNGYHTENVPVKTTTKYHRVEINF